MEVSLYHNNIKSYVCAVFWTILTETYLDQTFGYVDYIQTLFDVAAQIKHNFYYDDFLWTYFGYVINDQLHKN